MVDRQDQRAGDNSYNVQAGGDVNIATGASYIEVRAIAEDVFKANFLEMRGVAREEADRRARQVLDEFVDKLRAEQVDASASVGDPDMQFALFDAQKAYARSGEPELAHVLTDILLRRSKEPQRTTLQLVLNESLQVAPKLSVHQFDLLTLSWLMRDTRLNPQAPPTVEQVLQYYAINCEPFVNDLRVEDSSYSHLQYAGCGAVEMGQVSITSILAQTYPEVFKTQQAEPSIEKRFSEYSPVLAKISAYWTSGSPVTNFNLTSVGVAIANAHYVSRFPRANAPLSTWIK